MVNRSSYTNTRARRNGRTLHFNLAVGGLGGALLWLLMFCTSMFVCMFIQAIAFRWSVSLSIEVLGWWREVLNNLAGAVGA